MSAAARAAADPNRPRAQRERNPAETRALLRWAFVLAALLAMAQVWVVPLTVAHHVLPGGRYGPDRAPPDPVYFPTSFQNPQGLWLSWAEWRPPAGTATTAVVFLLGGLGDHQHRMHRLGGLLSAAGFHVVTMDHQGQGVSEGERTYVERFEHYVTDFRLFIADRLARDGKMAGKKLFLLGRSMGGLIALHVAFGAPTNDTAAAPLSTAPMAPFATEALAPRLAGVALLCPALEVDKALDSAAARAISGFLSHRLPKLALKNFPLTPVSRFVSLVQSLENDHLRNQRGLQVRFGAELLGAMGDVFTALAPQATLPLLLLHGTADRVTSPGGTQRFAAAAASADVTLRLYDGMWHELTSDPTDGGKHSDAVLADLFAFLNRLATATPPKSGTTS